MNEIRAYEGALRVDVVRWAVLVNVIDQGRCHSFFSAVRCANQVILHPYQAVGCVLPVYVNDFRLSDPIGVFFRGQYVSVAVGEVA